MSDSAPANPSRSSKASAIAAPNEQSVELLVLKRLAENLAFELRAADVIINRMLNTLTPGQRHKLASELHNLGVSSCGMTRANERHDELSRYDAVQERLKQH